MLGCSLVEFRAYLESQFTTGMTWENKGTWHIDHRRPCASFDFTAPEQDGALLAYIDDTHAPDILDPSALDREEKKRCSSSCCLQQVCEFFW